jgi:hypothetical protein
VSYVAANAWMEENKVAITNELLYEIAKDVLTGVRRVVVDAGINIRSNGIVEELEDRVDELETCLSDERARNMDLKRQLAAWKTVHS